ncbi:MAG: nucleoside kinase [Candidatus Metalachnospira sp.]|nr:nucleoside kinase [Candidatus Metalachnospira sp.]
MIEITAMNENLTVPEGTTYGELSKKYKDLFVGPIMAAKTGNTLKELDSHIHEGDEITFIDPTDPEGMSIYMRTTCLIMLKAVRDVLGEGTEVVIENSIKKNFYCEIHRGETSVDYLLVDKIKARMNEIIEADLPITRERFLHEDAIRKLAELGLYDKVSLYKYRKDTIVNLYRIDDYYDYLYGYMAPSSGCVYLYDIVPFERGFLINVPSIKNIKVLPEIERFEKITGVFMEQMDWSRLMEVKSVADLNDIIVNGEFGDLVRINEALHEKKIASIADMIYQKKDDVKLVLIAGPSSSGKTSFANRLGVQLRVLGIRPHVISMDDYFINRDETPVDEFGKRDYENISCIDIKQFNKDINDLIQGKTVELPSYNFVTGMREYKGKYVRLKSNEIMIIEGIHGLNDELTPSIKKENKFKIFISAMTQLNVDNHKFISTSDSRLLRRMVRDNLSRGSDAAATISAWPYVTRGEERNIFPYQENADAVFNSATIYEIAVLKQYAEPLLYKIDETMPEYLTAKRLIKFLAYFLSAPADPIPNNSLIREFVGGSVFHV